MFERTLVVAVFVPTLYLLLLGVLIMLPRTDWHVTYDTRC